VITDNNGENVKEARKLSNSQLKNVQSFLAKANKNSLKLEELINHSSQNSTSNSPKINYIP
jgi:hypothetical protein